MLNTDVWKLCRRLGLLAVLLVSLVVLTSPLLGEQIAFAAYSCCGNFAASTRECESCADAFKTCRAECSGSPLGHGCINVFTCDDMDPSNAVCECQADPICVSNYCLEHL
jgi:hypothetical protein